jgi:small GTP-binding protein
MTEKVSEIISRAEEKESAELNLSQLGITKLPEGITRLKHVRTLILSYNELEEFPKEISELKNLRALDLSYNHLGELPAEIAELGELRMLNLKSNHLSDLPGQIASLKNLTQLNLNNNQFRRLPPEIGQLCSLTQLYLMKNQLSELPDEFFDLTELAQLDLKHNQLSRAPTEIGNLRNLTFLNLSFNRLIELPKEIAELKNLIYLHAGFNQLIRLPKEIKELQNLFYLDVKVNLLNEIPSEIAELKNLKRLELEDNPLTFPPVEIVSQGLPAIMNYLTKLDSGGQNLYEGKLLILGQGGVGKTCLLKRLIHDEYSEEDSASTEGIHIQTWETTSPDDSQTCMTLNVWDFGGQEIYHATHQFFLTRRSLYILVWDARQEEEYGRIDYWLKTIETFAEDSPVLLVMNKSDERVKHLNFKDIKQLYPQVAVSGRVSAKKGAGIEALRKLIRQQAWELPLMGTFWPPSWVAVRRLLEKDRRYTLPYQEYLKCCEKYDIKEREAASLSRYLNDLGIILHFQNDALLRDTMILKPEWGTNAVYKVLDAKAVQERDGLLSKADLPNIWTDRSVYPPEKYAAILRLMENFELAFPIGAGEEYIVAELLPGKEPEYASDLEDFLLFEYHYKFMPAGLMTRLIVRMHEFLIRQDEKYLCWHQGAYFKYKENQAVIRMNPYIRVVTVKIQGENKREFLSLIRSHFATLHQSFRKIRVAERVPCNCSPECSYRFDYNFLLKCEEKGKKTQTCQVTIEEVNVRKLLDTVELPEIRQARLDVEREDYYPKIQPENLSEMSENSKKWYQKFFSVKDGIRNFFQ